MIREVKPPLPRAIVQGIQNLEPLPITATRLMKVLRQTEVSMAEVAGIIEYDEAVAAAVLRLGSTVEFASRVAPLTVREAVLRIGTERLLNIVLGQYLKGLRDGTASGDTSEDRLWLHSAAAELAIGAIAQEQPSLRLPPMASTAALLHDIGKLVMRRFLAPDYIEAVAGATRIGVTRVEAERELYGTDHADVGAALARKWQFPSEIVDAIAQHHRRSTSVADPLIDAVMTANLVAKVIGAVESLETYNVLYDGRAVTRLGLYRGGFDRACQQTRRWMLDLCRRAALPSGLSLTELSLGRAD